MRKALAVVIVLAAAAGAGCIELWLPVLLAPALVFMFFRLAGPRGVSGDSLSELKSFPNKDRDPSKLWLDGEWSAEIPGIGAFDVQIPCDLATIRELSTLSRPVVFKRKVLVEGISEKQRLMLRGCGAGGDVTVYIDGTAAGETSPGFLPYSVDITEHVTPGVEFQLAIRVNTPRDAGAPGKLDGIGPRYGAGLFRDVFIEKTTAVAAEHAWIEKKRDDPEPRLNVSVAGNANYPAAISVVVKKKKTGAEIFNGTEILPDVDGGRIVSFSVGGEAIEEWSTGSPVMYTVEVMIVCEDMRTSAEFLTGCKRFGYSSGRIRINSMTETLRGVARCEHYPPYGAAAPSWGAGKDVRAILDMGFNMVYCQDYPPQEAFWRACDEQGLYVVAEFPYRQIEKTAGEEKARETLRLETRRALSHPCFLFWAVDSHAAAQAAEHDGCEARVCLATRGRPGQESDGPAAVKLNVDMYTPGHYRKQLMRFSDFNADLLVLDYIDTAAGSESHGNRELRKASHDLETLKAADKYMLRAVVLGQFFTWGLRSGINSINRKKKASADSVKGYFRTGEAAEVTTGRHNVYLPHRIAIALLATLLACVVIIPEAGRFLADAPHLTLLFLPWWYAAAVQFFSWVVGAMCLTLYFEWRRRLLPGLAPVLGYPVFLGFYTSHRARTAVICCFLIWCTVAAAVAAGALTGGDFIDDALVPVMLASVFDLLLVVYMFVPASPYVMLGSLFALEFAFLSWFFGPAGALAAALIKTAPAAAFFAWLDSRNIFTA